VNHYEIAVVTTDSVLFEDGEIVERDHYIASLVREKRQICFVGIGVFGFVVQLAETYRAAGREFQFVLNQREQEMYSPSTSKRRRVHIDNTVTWFGWRHHNGEPYHRHLAIDPVTFYNHRDIFTLLPAGDNTEQRLMLWGVSLRNWCDENCLDLKSTTGGISGQLLRDPRFYPDNRRKVPKVINERARGELPGNFYRLYPGASRKEETDAYYLDQRRAHHYHAFHTDLPDSNRLYAYGSFRTLGDIRFSSPIPSFAGLYFCDLYTRQIPRNDPFGWFTCKDHSFSAFVWSNELPFLLDRGYEVRGIRAAWGSVSRDEGIKKYSAWSQGQLDSYPDSPWLKPILLGTYGVLACAPTDMQRIYRHTKGDKGKPVTLKAGHRQLHGFLVSLTNGRKLDSKVANVIHRGMIESATRIETLDCALYLHNKHLNILQLYADAVIVEDEGGIKLPFIPEPWTISEHLHHYKPIHEQAFVSGEMMRLPGVSGRERIRYEQNSRLTAPNVRFDSESVTDRRIAAWERTQVYTSQTS
jgi:hypothetical protein